MDAGLGWSHLSWAYQGYGCGGGGGGGGGGRGGRQITTILGVGEAAGLGSALLCVGLYFGILSRDCAEMCTVRRDC